MSENRAILYDEQLLADINEAKALLEKKINAAIAAGLAVTWEIPMDLKKMAPDESMDSIASANSGFRWWPLGKLNRVIISCTRVYK